MKRAKRKNNWYKITEKLIQNTENKMPVFPRQLSNGALGVIILT